MTLHESVREMPLAGIRVLEMGSLIAGPYAGALLAQFGAEVIKIEPPIDGDPLRKWRKLHNGTSLWWYAQNRNKRSVTLNLKTARGRDLARQLATTANIVIENFRPGTLEDWGLGWADLSALNPSLIMVRISGYGQTGPYSRRPGFAAVAESMGGLRHVTGFPDRPPVRTGVSLGDTLASLYGTIGALIAMHHLKGSGGRGQYVDVALYESVFAIMESLIPEYAAVGYERERTGATLPGISPSNAYPCIDGAYVVIAGNGDGIFKRLMTVMERRDLADDPALARNDGRVHHAERLDAAIASWTSERPMEIVLSLLEEAGVPCGRVYSAGDIYNDAHYRARGMIESATLPDGGAIELPGIVPKLSATPGQTRWIGPALGEHTREILASLGVEDEEFKHLHSDGVI